MHSAMDCILHVTVRYTTTCSVHANALFVPAALLQAPFYWPTGAEAGQSMTSMSTIPRDYGGLGGLMGHEVKHIFIGFFEFSGFPPSLNRSRHLVF